MLPPVISSICTFIGFCVLLFFAVQTFRFVTFFFIAPKQPLKNYKRTDSESWAMISGSSAGIGFSLADRLLTLSFGVIIFANEGVEDAEKQLRKAHPNGAIKSFTFDCVTASPQDIDEFVKSVQHLNITILSNNVSGVPMPQPAFRLFEYFEIEDVDNNINLSARFMTHLTRAMIPVLKKSANPRSLIINMSSGGRMGIPYISLYSACKGFNSSFSNSLAREFRFFNYPIDCLTVIPGETVSNGNRFVLEAGAPTAKEFAKIMVDRVDAAVSRGLLEVSPYWKHSLQVLATNILPESVILPEIMKLIEWKKKKWEEVHKMG